MLHRDLVEALIATSSAAQPVRVELQAFQHCAVFGGITLQQRRHAVRIGVCIGEDLLDLGVGVEGLRLGGEDLVRPHAAAREIPLAGEFTQGGWIKGQVPRGVVSAEIGESLYRRIA